MHRYGERFYEAVFLLITAAGLYAQQSTSADRILGALSDRSLAEHTASMKTDDRISMYSLMAKTKPDDAHYQVLLAELMYRRRARPPIFHIWTGRRRS